MALEVKEVSKSYTNQVALEKVNFTLNKGEFLGLLGHNGAGKSTLMKIICGILEPTSGELSWDNTTIHSNDFKNNLGYLAEQNPLYTDFYITEFLSFFAELYHLPKKRVRECMEMVGLSHQSQKKIKELSKGYQQRVGLAKALLNDPKLLILDEATTGLDPIQIIEIRNLIKDISSDKAVIFSTHILQEVEAICDRVMVLKQGKLISDLKLTEIANVELHFKELFENN